MSSLPGTNPHANRYTPSLTWHLADPAPRVGVRLRGDLVVEFPGRHPRCWLGAHLEYVLESRGGKSVTLVEEVLVAEDVRLSPGEAQHFPLSFTTPLPRPNFKGEHLSAYWRVRAVLAPENETPEPGPAQTEATAYAGRPQEYTMLPLVAPGQGLHQVRPQTLVTPKVSPYHFHVGGAIVAYGALLHLADLLNGHGMPAFVGYC